MPKCSKGELRPSNLPLADRRYTVLYAASAAGIAWQLAWARSSPRLKEFALLLADLLTAIS